MKKTLSIRSYLVLSHTLLLLISLGVIGIIWSRNEYRVITQSTQVLMRERVSLFSQIISHELAEHNELNPNSAEFSIIGQDTSLLTVYVDNSNKLYEMVPGSVSPLQEQQFLQLVIEHPVYEGDYATLIQANENVTSVYAAAPVYDSDNEVIGTVCLLMPLGDLDVFLLRLRWLLLGAIAIAALMGVGVSIFITNYFSRQFSHAQGMAATVSEGKYHLRIPEAGPMELRNLSHYLNQMAEKLQNQLKTRQTLLANVTHELARPLAGLQLGIESLRKGAVQDPDLADDLLVSMEQTIRRFESLIDDVTLAAQPETRPIELNPTALAVEPFLKGVATRFWSLAESRGIKIEVQIEAGLPSVLADERRLNQIIGNLVDNAVKFTPPNGIIQLSAERADTDNIRFLVHDSGQGLSLDEVKHLFEPFYQGNIGRRIKQGMGLGLSIAHQLAQVQGGSLTLENHPQGGALAILTLPSANA